MIKGRDNILDIPVDDAVVMRTLHAGQEETGYNMKRLSLVLLSNDRTYRSTPTASRPDKWLCWLTCSKELAAHGELECEVYFVSTVVQI